MKIKVSKPIYYNSTDTLTHKPKLHICASKGYLNSNNELQRTANETTIVELDSKTIAVMPGDEIMDGSVSSVTCAWKTPLAQVFPSQPIKIINVKILGSLDAVLNLPDCVRHLSADRQV